MPETPQNHEELMAHLGITPEQELIRLLLGLRSINDHEQTRIFVTAWDRPDWKEIADKILDMWEPVTYAEDQAPNEHRPEWDYLRTTPWDLLRIQGRKANAERDEPI